MNAASAALLVLMIILLLLAVRYVHRNGACGGKRDGSAQCTGDCAHCRKFMQDRDRGPHDKTEE
jgi:hypothetical protein